MSWGVQNIFLTPTHDWIHYCIWDWTRDRTREWDSALNVSAMLPVWPPKAAWYSPCVRLSWGGVTDARLDTVTRRERIRELGGSEYLLNPYTRLDTLLHLGLDPGQDPGVGFSLECECNVTCVAAQSGLV